MLSRKDREHFFSQIFYYWLFSSFRLLTSSVRWYCSVQFSCLVMSDSLRPHELQHAKLPCPSSTPRVYSNSCPLSRWCHPTSKINLRSLFWSYMVLFWKIFFKQMFILLYFMSLWFWLVRDKNPTNKINCCNSIFHKCKKIHKVLESPPLSLSLFFVLGF